MVGSSAVRVLNDSMPSGHRGHSPCVCVCFFHFEKHDGDRENAREKKMHNKGNGAKKRQKYARKK